MVLLKDIQKAAEVIRSGVLRTPLIYSPTFSKMTDCEVYLKLENLQRGGSFKIRGASYKIWSHPNEARRGVIAASLGNHAQGVALAAQAASVPATIVMPTFASIAKQEATRGYGAKLILKGENLSESIGFGKDLAKDRIFVHPYDDPDIIAGQGTIGLEVLEDLPDIDAIIVPVGGGGLISGIAVALKSQKEDVRVIGVQTASCPSAIEALKAGRPISLDVSEKNSIADAIMVPRVGDADFPIIRDNVDEIVAVDEDQIAAAVLMLLERKRILSEGAGAAPLAALLSQSPKVPKGGKVVLVVSGGNLDSLLLDRVIHRGLLLKGRLMRLSLTLDDAPGSLAELLDLVAKLRANVVHIHHSRNERGLPIDFTRVELELETRDFEHIKDISSALNNAGYRMDLR
jgi:threonine dehydratase